MRVLVTGHQGYVGPEVVAALKSRGHSVVGLDSGYFQDCVDDRLPLVAPDAEIACDMRDVERRMLEGANAVVHLAGLSNDPLGKLVPELTSSINHAATVRLAHLAIEAGVARFVFASSCSLYGASADVQVPLDETAQMRPVSAYAVSKVACERDLAPLAGPAFVPVFLRFATAFGLSPRMRFDLVLANLIGWARATGVIKVMSDGTPWRPLVHIQDMAHAIACAVEAPADSVCGQAFNIGMDANNVQVRDLAETVRRQVPGSRIDITGEMGGDPRSYRVDFSKVAAGLPGFRPRWTVEMGCEQIDRWVVDRRIGLQEFESRRFVRLKQLQHLMQAGTLDGELRFRVSRSGTTAP